MPKAATTAVKSKLGDFALTLEIAQILWRRYPQLVEAESLEEPFLSAFRSWHNDEPYRNSSILGEDELVKAGILPKPRRASSHWEALRSVAAAPMPEWAATTPAQHMYRFEMYDDYSGAIDAVDVSRSEYVHAKLFVAGLRGFSFAVARDFAPEREEVEFPEWVTHTPKEAATEDPSKRPYYTLSFSDGHGEVPQCIFVDRAEFEFLKRCLAARREDITSSPKAAEGNS